MKKILCLLVFAGLFTILSGGEMSLESGKYKIVFHDMPHRWSIIHIFCDGVELGTRTGYYGNVMAPASGKYIGAGHTEGGTEKFLEGTVAVDDGEAVPVAPGVFKGEKVVFKKSSMLANLKLFCTYTLTPEGLRIDKQFTAIADQKVHQFYLWQFCWTKETKDYLFLRRDGSMGKGKFLNDNGHRMRGEREAYFVSQYWPEKKYGFVNFIAEYGKLTGRHLLWDIGRAYHKYYFWVDLPKVVKAGYSSPEMTMIVKAFPVASEAEWETKAKEIAAELRTKYPFAKAPINTDEGVSLPPHAKFQVKKYPLYVDSGSQYAFSLEICKSAGGNGSPYDSRIMIGYNDAENPRKAKMVGTFADKLAGDGKFHKIQGKFNTPPGEAKFYIYIYNSRSTGTVTVRNLTLEKL